MTKKTTKTTLYGNKRDDTAAIIARIHGVSARYVRMVAAGERNNDAILSSIIEMKQGKNELIEAVKKLVPFN